MDPEQFFFKESEANLFEFEKILREKNKDIESNSPLDKIALKIIEMYENFKKEVKIDLCKDYREDWRRAIGLDDLIRKILIRKDHPDFNKLWRHIILLLEDSNIVQNIWSPRQDDVANKIFELYMALSFMGIGSDLEVDHPKKSSEGKNPDVMLTISNQRWALACKTLHSNQMRTLIDRITDGIGQIERSNADKGLVVVSLKNLINHDVAWPIKIDPISKEIDYIGFGLEEDAKNGFCQMAAKVSHLAMQELQGEEGIGMLFDGKKALPFVLGYYSTVVGLLRNGVPTFTLLRLLYPFEFRKISTQDFKIIEDLNRGMHDQI